MEAIGFRRNDCRVLHGQVDVDVFVPYKHVGHSDSKSSLTLHPFIRAF